MELDLILDIIILLVVGGGRTNQSGGVKNIRIILTRIGLGFRLRLGLGF